MELTTHFQLVAKYCCLFLDSVGIVCYLLEWKNNGRMTYNLIFAWGNTVECIVLLLLLWPLGSGVLNIKYLFNTHFWKCITVMIYLYCHQLQALSWTLFITFILMQVLGHHDTPQCIVIMLQLITFITPCLYTIPYALHCSADSCVHHFNSVLHTWHDSIHMHICQHYTMSLDFNADVFIKVKARESLETI